jgi:hypothetical protein
MIYFIDEIGYENMQSMLGLLQISIVQMYSIRGSLAAKNNDQNVNFQNKCKKKK